MARAKPKRRHTNAAWLTPVTLSEDTIDDLASILGIVGDDDLPRLRELVEGALGRHHGDAEILDNAPRPAHAAAALRPVADHAQRLWEALGDLDTTSRGKLRRLFPQLHAVESRLGDLAGFAHAIAAENEQAESRHAPTRQALGKVVRRLVDIFDQFAGPATFSSSSDGISDERPLKRRDLTLDFVTAALKAGGIDHPNRDQMIRYLPSEKDRDL